MTYRQLAIADGTMVEGLPGGQPRRINGTTCCRDKHFDIDSDCAGKQCNDCWDEEVRPNRHYKNTLNAWRYHWNEELQRFERNYGLVTVYFTGEEAFEYVGLVDEIKRRHRLYNENPALALKEDTK